MLLPSLPYNSGKTRQQIIQFLGINLSENVTEGELRDSAGISTDNFPVLSQRKKYSELSGYTEPTDVYEWDGKLIVVDSGQLYYDGDPLCNVNSDPKQFAVVNTKLVVWPDKLQVDLVNKSVVHMDAATTNASEATITGSTIQLVSNVMYSSFYSRWDMDYSHYWAWSYGSASWDETNGWTLTDAQMLPMSQWENRVFIPTVTYVAGTNEYVVGIFPYYVTESSQTPAYPEPEPSNDVGFITILTHKDSFAIGSTTYKNENYWLKTNNEQLAELFHVGDTVNVSGTPYGLLDRKKIVITGINTDTNTLTFAADTFSPIPIATYENTTARAAGWYQMVYSSDGVHYARFRATEKIPADTILVLEGTTVHVKDSDTMEDLATYSASIATSSWEDTNLNSTTYSVDNVAFEIRRNVPELDYICESNNRLWGVSNADKTIYASALGLPTDFWTYAGIDTDSYAVAVGSEGDFTGICELAGGVCCWKEERLHKILGDYPSEYYMNEYQVAGVQKGSYRSMVTINDTLYYKGVHGVYATTGGSPSLISYKLGTEIYTDGVGGTDGVKYYLDVKDPDGDYHMFVYDLIHGLWIQEATIPVIAFTKVNGILYFLDRDGIKVVDDASDEVIDWYAEFVPVDDVQFITKGYTKLLFRLDMSAGSYMKVDIREDRRPWRTAWSQQAVQDMTIRIPLRLGRCDRFAIKISGYGPVVVRSVAREFSIGSEVLKL